MNTDNGKRGDMIGLDRESERRITRLEEKLLSVASSLEKQSNSVEKQFDILSTQSELISQIEKTLEALAAKSGKIDYKTLGAFTGGLIAILTAAAGGISAFVIMQLAPIHTALDGIRQDNILVKTQILEHTQSPGHPTLRMQLQALENRMKELGRFHQYNYSKQN